MIIIERNKGDYMILTYPVYTQGFYVFSLKVWDRLEQKYLVKKFWTIRDYSQAIAKYNQIMQLKIAM